MSFQYISPHHPAVPILISIPHCGTNIPNKLNIKTSVCSDTDWFLEHLYDFAPHMGIGVIHATFARYVVDLNRSPSSAPLYSDGRILTDAIPLRQFDGTPLYESPPSEEERAQRLSEYFFPYHQEIQKRLESLRSQFGWALLFDAHSIKRHVPTIQKEPFPDMILGSNDRCSASENLIEQVWKHLNQSSYRVTHNTPFKGGYITRSFGNPSEHIHALQLEMSQDLYLDEQNPQWAPERAHMIQSFLKTLCTQLLKVTP